MKSLLAWTLVAVGAVAAFLYSNFLIDVILSKDHDWFAVVSELEVKGTPHANLLRTTDVICAGLILILMPYVYRALPDGRWRGSAVWLTAVFGVTNGLAGVFALPCRADEVCTTTSDAIERWIHDGLSIVSAVALFLGAAAVAIDTGRHGPRWLNRAGWLTFWIGGVVGTIVFGVAGYIDPTSWGTGIAQRAQLIAMSAWIICLAWFAGQSVDARRAEPG